MKRFRFQADIEFDAEDIDDAFARLAQHFSALCNEEESELGQRGEMTIYPIPQEPV